MSNTSDFDSAGGGFELPAWQAVSNLDEQRAYPRITIDIPVAFRNASGQHCAAKLRNISPDGLQVRCNLVTAQIIHPRGGKIGDENQPLLQATAVLPLSSGPETLSVGVRLLYTGTLSDAPHCVLGFQFLNLRPKARRIIDTFFAEQMRQYYLEVDERAA